ncbi:hypothetical protein NDU88_001330 [Pleurodeles waltl]|uniref:Uncharacterized protein n=1 Tax=Pleurodeles waltl TaxID=8319 RepID=A0AAV7TIC7_PLEWA|nr:hypothetical protein NDU88_001330 [Pleurodeles waltl]
MRTKETWRRKKTLRERTRRRKKMPIGRTKRSYQEKVRTDKGRMARVQCQETTDTVRCPATFLEERGLPWYELGCVGDAGISQAISSLSLPGQLSRAAGEAAPQAVPGPTELLVACVVTGAVNRLANSFQSCSTRAGIAYSRQLRCGASMPASS